MDQIGMNSWDLFKTAVAGVVDNLGAALRISGGVFIIAIFTTSAINVAFFGQLHAIALNPEQPEINPAQIISPIALLIAFSWISVNWHRFIILGETNDRLLPGWNFRRIINYCLRSLGVVLIATLVVTIPIIILLVVFASMGMTNMSGIFILMGVLIGFYAFFRIALTLPACEIDQPITMLQSLEMTKTYRQAILGLAGLNMVFSVLASSLSGLLSFDNFIGVVFSGAVQWAMILISASFLTTLYQAAMNNKH